MVTIREEREIQGQRLPRHFPICPSATSFLDPDSAPLDTPVQVRVKDDCGPYTLTFPCRRTPSGWVNDHNTPLAVEVIGWRYRSW